MSEKKSGFQKMREARNREIDRRTAKIKQKYEARKATLAKQMKALEEEFEQKRLAVAASVVCNENRAVMAAFEHKVRHETLDEKKKSIEHDIRSIAWRMNNKDPEYLEGIRQAIFKPQPKAKK